MEIQKSGRWEVDESYSGPSRKMKTSSTWIETDMEPPSIEKTTFVLEKTLTARNFIVEFPECWNKNKTINSQVIKLLNEPFKVGIVKELISDKKLINGLIEEMQYITWNRKQMDLYELYQTTDLANIQSNYLSKFYEFLNTSVLQWMQQLTNMKFKKVSVSCSMYNCGDYLLTHDDLLSDRLIAFVYYVSPWKGKQSWTDDMGGSLELFSTDSQHQPTFPAAYKINPSNNQFVFFKVEKKSYHQVEEVLTKDYPRLTINGWFHGFSDNKDYNLDAIKVKNPNLPLFKSPSSHSFKLEEFIRKVYLKNSVKLSIQKQVEENSEAALEGFLVADFYQKVCEELVSGGMKWLRIGPTNQQNYEILRTEKLKESSTIKSLLALISAPEMFKLLFEYTELDFYGKDAGTPKYSVEIQRWNGGCYTLLGDPSTFNNSTLDLILYFNDNENIGATTYLTPEGVDEKDENMSDDENESVLLTVYPLSNVLNVVYRSEGTAKFTKYCTKSAAMKTKYNYILVASFKE